MCWLWAFIRIHVDVTYLSNTQIHDKFIQILVVSGVYWFWTIIICATYVIRHCQIERTWACVWSERTHVVCWRVCLYAGATRRHRGGRKGCVDGMLMVHVCILVISVARTDLSIVPKRIVMLHSHSYWHCIHEYCRHIHSRMYNSSCAWICPIVQRCNRVSERYGVWSCGHA